MSNVVDNETGRPLGGGKITHIMHHNEVKVGLIGLVEKEWLDTLPTIDPNEVTYIDFIKAGNQLADELHNQVIFHLLLNQRITVNPGKLGNVQYIQNNFRKE